jgi:hypothetical protein
MESRFTVHNYPKFWWILEYLEPETERKGQNIEGGGGRGESPHLSRMQQGKWRAVVDIHQPQEGRKGLGHENLINF